MSTIQTFLNNYSKNINRLDLELIVSHVLKKPREFVLAHPEYPLTNNRKIKCEQLIKRRVNNEPLAYILGHKEFYGLSFKVNKNTLIPRPETEQLVELVLKNMLKAINYKSKAIIDVGTGSGNIIISIAKAIKNFKLIGMDISADALKIAKQNAKLHKVDKKINFIKSDLLTCLLKNKNNLLKNCLPVNKVVNCKLIIVSNLPYLSQKIYNSTTADIKNFEPKSALLSKHNGLAHYKKLFSQIKKLSAVHYMSPITCLIEFSPEQKIFLQKIIKQIFPKAKVEFYKDLANKWRVAEIEL